MNTILNTCLDLQKKQAVMQDTQLEKLLAFKETLQAQKEALSQSKLLMSVVSFFLLRKKKRKKKNSPV